MSLKNQEISDKEIIAEVLNGNRNAYELLVKKYQTRIYSIVFRYLNNKVDTDDIVQNTFIRAIENLRKFDVNKEFFPWICTIAINLARNALKKKEKRLKHITKIDNGKEIPANNGEPLNKLIYTEIERKVREAIENLSPKFKEAFILVVQEGLSYEETAEILRIPPGTVMSRLNRARQKLKKRLKNYLE